MFTPVHCIALRTVKVSDDRSLLSVWTREIGRATFSMPSGSGREAKRRKALTSPLAIFEGVVDIKPGKEILSVKDFKVMSGTLAYESSPVKGLISMFLAEVLDLLLRRQEADEILSDYLFNSLQIFLDLEDPIGIANFHLVFLYGLCRLGGLEPDLSSYSERAIFDMREGRYRATQPLHDSYLAGNTAFGPKLLSRMNYRNMHKVLLSRSDRVAMLNKIIEYIGIHFVPLTSLKSLDVLKTI